MNLLKNFAKRQEEPFKFFHVLLPHTVDLKPKSEWTCEDYEFNFAENLYLTLPCLKNYNPRQAPLLNSKETLDIQISIEIESIRALDLHKKVHNSVRQTNSALSNLSLNIQGHVEVPKSIFFLEKIMSVSCNQPLYVKI